VAAYGSQSTEWSEYFTKKDAGPGLPANYIKNPTELKALSAYFAWAAWACSANRPGKDYSYTNNWPYEPMVGNRPSAEAYVWSAYESHHPPGWSGPHPLRLRQVRLPGLKGEGADAHMVHSAVTPLTLTPSQWATGWYFAIVALLFLAQSLLGGALAHYRVEPGAFYGIDIARFLPYTLARTWHLQLAIFWIATAWVGGRLFLAPGWVARSRGARKPASTLFWVRWCWWSLAAWPESTWASTTSWGNSGSGSGTRAPSTWISDDFWQFLLAAGLLFWLVLMFRALRPAIKDPGKRELSSLFLYAAVAIPVFYLPALFYGPHSNFAVIDNWRFWIIHLWVEGSSSSLRRCW